MKNFTQALAVAALTIGCLNQASASSVAIVTGGWYTPNLKNELVSKGVSVTEISSYTAASLSGFDAVIQYGNSFVSTSDLQTYVTAGGRLILTPWAGLNFALTPSLQVFDNGGSAQFSVAYPGVTVLDAGNALLNGVSLPAGAGGFNLGRISGIHTTAGVVDVADWADGTDFIGTKTLGSGSIIGINMHVITSDTAYNVIDQPWATQLFLNAVNGQTANVPEPGALLLVSLGLFGIAASRRSRSA